MYRVEIDVNPGDPANPRFDFQTIEELYSFVRVCFDNGHVVMIAKIEVK